MLLQRIIVCLFGCITVVAVQAGVIVEEGFVRGLPPGQPNTAAFMTLTNSGDQELILQAVSSDVANNAEVHVSRNSNGMMTMQRVEGLAIAAGSSVQLEPGGHHLMLLGLHQALKEGDDVKLQFTFSDGSQTATTLKVRSVLNENTHQHH